MSLKLKQARNANQRIKDLINGYIRLKYTNNNVPVVINYICLLYYLLKDKFGKHGRSLKLSSSNQNSTDFDIVVHDNRSDWNTVYGTVEIDTSKYKNGIASWTVKVGDPEILIGIDSSNHRHIDRYLTGDDEDPYYAWYGLTGCLHQLGSYHYKEKMFVGGDVIKVELNIAKAILKFYKNGEDINLQFDNIDTSKIYSVVVCPSLITTVQKIFTLFFSLTKEQSRILN